MKRLLLCVMFLSSVALLGGCPVYSGPSEGQSCGAYGCYSCPSGSSPSDGTCIPWSCSTSSECPTGYSCGGSGRGGLICVPASTSASADAGNCGSGCASGYVCKLSGGQTQCVPVSQSGDAANPLDAFAHDSGANGMDGSPVAEEPPPQANDATDVAELADTSLSPDGSPDGAGTADAPTPTPCNANSECGATETCIDGMCTTQNQLCSDTTQCVAAGEACVNGICQPHCSTTAPCPSGYACDFTRGVCSLNPSPCTGSGTANCQGGSTCVEGRCVAPCTSGDSGPACAPGQLCVNGGCIPDEAARFACKNDGQSGSLATSCAITEICLHHDCYSECDPDAANPCADPSASCKQVTISAGTYVVCAAASNLGSDCDLAAGKPCANGVCIDGYCK